MNTFLKDIFAQPQALHDVLAYTLGEGRPALVKTAQMIRDAPRVVLTSMGSAYFSLLPVAYTLSRLHPNVHLIETSELMRMPSFPETVYVIMSRSGESGEIAQYSRWLHEQGKPLIAITMSPDSTLAHNAMLTMHDPAPYDGFICTKAYSTMALIGLLVSSEIEQAIDDSLYENLRQAFDWMEMTNHQNLQTVQQIDWCGEDITFLSRGAGLGLAAAGALWVEEAARIRAAYSSIDAFLHGPVEQVDENFAGVWIDLQPDAQSAAQYQNVMSKGGKWITIVLEDAYNGDFMVPAFDLPNGYRILPATIPVQMIGYQSATNRGLDAGTMRYLSWVVK